MEVIEIHNHPFIRATIKNIIQRQGVKSAELIMLADGFHPSFVKAFIKSILKKGS